MIIIRNALHLDPLTQPIQLTILRCLIQPFLKSQVVLQLALLIILLFRCGTSDNSTTLEGSTHYNTTTTDIPISSNVTIPAFKAIAGASGTGKTTRYWDCCKPSCSWDSNVQDVTGVTKTCKVDGYFIAASTFMSGCEGGDGYMCTNNQPVAVTDKLAYGYAAASIAGLDLKGGCCQCYKLDFTSGPVVGKSMIVQVTNSGADLGENHFDLQIPGGGVGIFDGCTSQWKIEKALWGKQYGGISSVSECKNLPAKLQPGCKFRYGWFKNADNPTMKFKRVVCPAAIVKNTGCQKNDELA